MLNATGTGFTGDTSTVELYIANTKQTTKSVSSTEAIFTIVDVASSALNSNMLYFPEGIPENHTLVQSSFNMTPKYVSVTPNSGSIGGSLLNVTAPGVSKSSTVDILASDGSSICANASVASYGVITCKTNPGEITSQVLSIKVDGVTHACVNSDNATCTYAQLAASSFPTSTSTSKTTTTIVFTGTNYDISGFSANASFGGVVADSIVIDSANQVTATFTKGVPVVNSETAPVLTFTSSSTTEEYYSASDSKLANAISVTASSSGLECSFAGGCTYEVTAEGLT